MEGNQQLDLKSDEVEKKGLSKTSVYLSKNADAVDAPPLEPPQNEGIMSLEDSSENVKMDIAEESKEEVDSIGCCSCFSFNLFKGRWRHFWKCKVETADNRIPACGSKPKPKPDPKPAEEPDPGKIALHTICGAPIPPSKPKPEFKRPVKVVEIPEPEGP